MNFHPFPALQKKQKERAEVCRNYACTPLGGECSSSAQCTEKDSFCCLDDSCGKKGFCLPYDESVTHDEACRFTTKPGIFEAQIQCRWQPTDIETGSKYVEMPPLVGPFGNSAGLKTVIAVWSYSPTVLRFINPETCETLESIKASAFDSSLNLRLSPGFSVFLKELVVYSARFGRKNVPHSEW